MVLLSLTGLRMVLYPDGWLASRFSAMAILNFAMPFLNQLVGRLLRTTHGGVPGSSLKKVLPCSPYSNRVNVLVGSGSLRTWTASGAIKAGCFSIVASCQSSICVDCMIVLLMLILCLLLIVSLILIGYGQFHPMRVKLAV